MKVTQVIKEAITARIMAKCREANKDYQLALDEEEKRLDNERNQCLDALREEHHKIFIAMLEKLDDKKIDYHYVNYSGNVTRDKEDIWEKNRCSYYLNLTSDLAEELEAKIKENQDKAKKYINDIILELELGESKPTLESLLTNIKF